MRRAGLLVRLFVGPLSGLLAAVTGCAPAGPPNILLISLDTVRADHTTPYGAANDTTPVLAALAREGAVYTRSFSDSNESAYSHGALFTGRYPSELALPVYETYALPPQASTVAEALHAYGYATAAFSAGGHVTADFGFDQGWDTFSAEDGFGSFQQTGPKAAAWIEAEHVDATGAAQPWFAFLHSYDAHRPYVHDSVWDHLYADGPGTPLAEALCRNTCLSEMVLGNALMPDIVPSWFRHKGGQRILAPEVYGRLASAPSDALRVAITAADQAHVKAHYDGALRYADTLLGVTLSRLQLAGKLDNTVVIVLSDHGEDLLDHGYMNHRTGLYDTCTRVPLVVWGPGFEGLGAVDGLVDSRDVAATVLALAGARAPAGSGGRDLRAVARGEDPVDAVFAEGVMDMVTVRTATHRLVYSAPLQDPDYIARLEAAPEDGADFVLYDVQADPGEQVDVHLRDRAVTAALKQKLLTWRRGLRPGDYALPQDQVSPSVARSLREHGYWDDPARVEPGGADPAASALDPAATPSKAGVDARCLERFDFMPASVVVPGEAPSAPVASPSPR